MSDSMEEMSKLEMSMQWGCYEPPCLNELMNSADIVSGKSGNIYGEDGDDEGGKIPDELVSDSPEGN